MPTRIVQIFALLMVLFIAPPLANAKDEKGLLTVQVAGVADADMAQVAKVLAARVDGLRSGWFGSTSTRVDGHAITVFASGWQPDRALAEAAAVSGRELRFMLEQPPMFKQPPSILLTEADVADAISLPGSEPGFSLRLRFNESGVEKLKARSKSIVGQMMVCYWNGQAIVKARVAGDLAVRTIEVAPISKRDATLIAAVLSAGPLPRGTTLTLVK